MLSTLTKRRRRGRAILLRQPAYFALALAIINLLCGVHSYQLLPSVTKWSKQIQGGYQCRIAADPSFPQKSLTEVLLAAGTQFAAEWNRRGADHLILEADFVLPAILTAVFGKYYR